MLSQFVKKSASYIRFEKQSFLQYANKQREERSYTDVVIKVGDEYIPAHRLVLSYYSEFFKNEFKTKENEQHEGTVEIRGIDAKSMKMLIVYIYTGCIEIDDENVLDLLACASYLQLDDVRRCCFEFLESVITPETFFIIQKTAEVYKDEALKNIVSQYASRNFNTIAQTSSFKNFSKADLITCILNLDKYLTKQTSVYDAVISWIKRNTEDRKYHLVELFHFIDFSKISVGFLATVALEEDIVKRNLESANVVMNALAQNVLNKSRDENYFKMFSLVFTDDATYLSLRPIDENFDQVKVDYPNIPEFDDYAKAVRVNNFVFCITALKVWRLNLEDQNKEWKIVNRDKRLLGSTCALFNSALIVSGYGQIACMDLPLGEYPGTRARFVWQKMPVLNQPRYGHSSVSCNDCLYALGGFDFGNDMLIPTVERLPRRNMQWESVASMIIPRRQFVAVNYKNFIFVLGGRDKCGTALKSVERFDCFANAWTFVNEMQIARYFHTACVVDDKIFVAGGFNDSFKVSIPLIESYDILRGQWSIVLSHDFNNSEKIISLTT